MRSSSFLAEAPPTVQAYRGLSLKQLWRHGSAAEKRWLLGGWLLSLAICIASGLATVIYRWSGLPLDFGGVQVYITLYPPLLICLWWALCIGWLWGAVPAYLATLTLALYAGMPVPWALLFACANPLGFAVLTQSYRSVAMRLDMRSPPTVLFYVLLSFVAAVFSSSGALIWCYTNRMDSTAVLPIWQGWWLGAFLQSTLLVGPALFLTWPRVARWQEGRSVLWHPESDGARRLSLRLILVVVSGVLVYGLLTLWLGTRATENAMDRADLPALQAAVGTMIATTWVFYWVSALIILFIGFFGYRMFTHWSSANEHLLAALAKINGELHLAARTDILSGLLNRRAMEEALDQQTRRTQRFGERAALVMLDIDHFKAINDQHGHDVGDAVIQALSRAIGETVRGIDVSARWGGEEFLLLLPNVDGPGALVLAERLREHVAGMTVGLGAHAVSFTISLGVAMADPAATRYAGWLKHADEALYEAKGGGRNRTVVWEDLRRAVANPGTAAS